MSHKVPLHRKGQIVDGAFAIVDADDLALVASFKWHIFKPKGSRTYYARSARYKKTLYLHSLILGAAPRSGVEIDHEDGNGLNNSRTNLRWLSHAENIRSAAQLMPFAERESAVHVHRVVAKGRVYFYDRRTKRRLSDEEARERMATT